MLTSLAVVMPVRNAEKYIAECLDHLLQEVGAEQVTVVDDASEDSTVALARSRGVTVLQHIRPEGPYNARNTGWRAAEAEIVIFTDVRCRPEPGWAHAMYETLSEPGVAIAGCDIIMVAGSHPTTAERWGVSAQPLGLRGHIENEYLPYVPTACMAIRRKHLEALGGFRSVRSGADADLCWRAQQMGLGSVAPSKVGMWARPRTTQKGVIQQYRRYALSAIDLQALHRYLPNGPSAPSRKGTLWRVAQGLWRHRLAPAVALLDARKTIAHDHAFRREVRALARREGEHHPPKSAAEFEGPGR